MRAMLPESLSLLRREGQCPTNAAGGLPDYRDFAQRRHSLLGHAEEGRNLREWPRRWQRLRDLRTTHPSWPGLLPGPRSYLGINALVFNHSSSVQIDSTKISRGLTLRVDRHRPKQCSFPQVV